MVSYNTVDHIEGAVDSLLAQSHDDLQIIVVDNNSHDGSADEARRVAVGHDHVRVVANPRNVGYAEAANQALEHAVSGGFFLVTPDVRLDPDHISHCVAMLHRKPRAGSVQGRLHRMDADGQVLRRNGRPILDSAGHTAHTNRVFRNRGDGLADDGQVEDPAEVFGVCGAAALHRVEALHDVAYLGEVFDSTLFAFFEDVDLDWRMRARGWQAWYTPDAVGLHERGGDGPRRSAIVERLSYRNWFLTVLKNDEPSTMWPDAHLLGATTILRTADLALTVPTAFAKALTDVRLVPQTLAKRRHLQRHRTVSAAAIVQRWFEPFDYQTWISKRIRRGW